MKKMFFAAVVTLVSVTVAHAFDTNAYCSKVSDSIGGSYQIEMACRQQEKIAESALSRTSIPARVESYCRKVAESIGGSYQIMDACVSQELSAKSKLH